MSLALCFIGHDGLWLVLTLVQFQVLQPALRLPGERKAGLREAQAEMQNRTRMLQVSPPAADCA